MSNSQQLNAFNQLFSFLLKNSWILTVLILVIAFLMMIPNIGAGIWEDEFITYREAVLGEPVALTGKPATFLDIQPMLAKLGHYIVGEPWGIRIPSILFGLGTIFFIGKLANDLFGKEVKYMAMVIATFSPILIEFSSEGRPYTALTFWGIVFLYVLNKHMEKESISSSTSLALISIFGLLTRLTFLGQLAIGGLIYLSRKRKLTVYSLSIIAIVTPFIIRSVMEVVAYDSISTKLTDATQTVDLVNFSARTLFSYTFGYNTFEIPDISMSRNIPISQLVSANLWVFSFIAIVGVGFLAGFVMLLTKLPRKVIPLLLYILVPSIFTVLVAQTGYTVIREKFLIAVLGAYLILISAMFRELLRFKVGYLVVGLYFIVIGLGFYNFYFQGETHNRRTLLPELNSKLLTEFTAGDVLVSYVPLDRTPRYYTILNENINHVVAFEEAIDKSDYRELAQNIMNSSSEQTIFLIDDTAWRHQKDSEAVLIKTFKSGRDWKRIKFGRNLSLYIFEN